MGLDKKISPQGLTKSESYDIALQAIGDIPPSGGDSPPSSIVVTSGSYTIPNGYFAKVKANVWSGGYLNINGGTVLKSLNLSYGIAVVGKIAWRADGTSPAYLLCAQNNSGFYVNWGYLSSSSTAYNQSASSHEYTVPEGTVLAVVGNGTCCVELYLE